MRGVFSHTTSSSENNKNIYKVGHNIKLQTTDDILKANITQSLFELVVPIAGLPEDYFSLIYKDLVKQFATFVNILPRDLQSGLGSLYCGSLYGAFHTLKKFVEEKPEADCLWRFAVFSAALLKQCNAPAKNYQIVVTDTDGHFRERWNPFYETLAEIDAKHCKLYSFNNLFVHNHAILMGMVITKLMPREAMQWLQSNGDLFAQWLDCLQSEYDVAGVLGEALEPLKDEELISQWEEKIAVELIETPETAPGEILDQWIREAIANGDLKINTPDAHIHIISDGLNDAMFVDQGIMHDFSSKLASSPLSSSAAVSQFYAIFGPSQQHALALAMPGLTRRNSLMGSGGGATSNTQVHKGALADPSNYFGKEQTPAKSDYAKQSSGKESKTAINRLAKIIEGAQEIKSSNAFKQRTF